MAASQPVSQTAQQPLCVGESLSGSSRQALREGADQAQPLGSIRDGYLGSARRRWCPHVGDEVRDREVHLMADSRDHGCRQGVQRSCHDFLVERPQILERTSAARENQQIAVAAPIGECQRLSDLGGRLLPLNRGRVHQNPYGRESSTKYRDDISDRGAAW